MKTHKQAFVVLAVGILITPQIAMAAWWNPISWSVWNFFRSTPKVQQVQIATTTPTTSTATTTKKAETNTKQDTLKDNKDSVISSLKKQVADLTQKENQPNQPKVEIPKTSVITLPSGAVVEINANGNVIRTITAAPQQTYTAPAPMTQQIQSTLSPPVSPTPTLTPAPTPVTLLVPGSIKVSTNKLNNYMEIALNPQIEHNERIDIIATVKDISGNPASNQTVIFENGYSSAKMITDSNGVADVCFIADSGGFVGSEVWYGQTSIIARVVIPTSSTFIQDKILVNAPIDQNLKNLDRRQQGHLYEFSCQ